jgi:stage II sporulation protein D
MTLKTLLFTGMLSGALLAPMAMTQVHGGILDIVVDAFTPKPVVESPKIRVLLAHDQPGVVLEVRGKYKIYDPRTNTPVAVSYHGKRRLLQAQSVGMVWGEEFPGVHQLAIYPDSPNTIFYVDGIEQKGALFVYDVGNSISIVNRIDVEDYLSAVLPQQYKAQLPEELLAGIAITARTASYYSAQHSKTPYWDVDAAKEGYQGSALKFRSPAFDKAIRKTQYIALQHSPEEEGKLTPMVAWNNALSDKRYQGITYSAITFDEADKLAKNGKNAAQILKEAFPKASLELMFKPTQS